MLRNSILAALFVVSGSAAGADAPPAPDASRGELLYSTHCVFCHTTEVHWREKKVAADRAGVQAQVVRWQDNLGLKWSNDDIAEVARYLNAAFYHYPASN
jgi:hypothetical protein